MYSRGSIFLKPKIAALVQSIDLRLNGNGFADLHSFTK